MLCHTQTPFCRIVHLTVFEMIFRALSTPKCLYPSNLGQIIELYIEGAACLGHSKFSSRIDVGMTFRSSIRTHMNTRRNRMTKPASLRSSRFTHCSHTRHLGPFTSELDRLNISRLGTVFIIEGARGQEH